MIPALFRGNSRRILLFINTHIRQTTALKINFKQQNPKNVTSSEPTYEKPIGEWMMNYLIISE